MKWPPTAGEKMTIIEPGCEGEVEVIEVLEPENDKQRLIRVKYLNGLYCGQIKTHRFRAGGSISFPFYGE